MEDGSKGVGQAAAYLPPRIRAAVAGLEDGDPVQEIRLRAGRPLAVGAYGREDWLSPAGKRTGRIQEALTVSPEEVKECFLALCQYSIHSFTHEVAGGFLTLPGGHRAGLCGTAVLTSSGGVETQKHLSGINIRIARQKGGCADPILSQCYAGGARRGSLLLAGPPASGKTTVLRDLCRQLGKRYKVTVIDERGELAACWQGTPQNDIGPHSDVLDGFSKELGIPMALRVLSPDLIAVDEIGGEADSLAIERCLCAGVDLIATAHAGSAEELYRRPHLRRLLEIDRKSVV